MKVDIPGLNYYCCDRDGNIYSKDRFSRYLRKGKKIHPLDNGRGYKQVSISENGKITKCLIHRLVALTFLGPSDMEINHIDGDKLNNSVSNLEYVTRSENMQHSFKTGLNRPNNKGKKFDRVIYKCYFISDGIRLDYKSVREAAIQNKISYWSLRKDIDSGSSRYLIYKI